MKMNKKGNGAVWVILIIVAVLVIWGFIGGAEAQSVGVTCDMGVGDTLCWKWHTNTIGKVEQFFGG